MEQQLQNNKGAIIFIPEEGEEFYIETNSQNTLEFIHSLGFDHDSTQYWPYYGSVWYFKLPKSFLINYLSPGENSYNADNNSRDSENPQQGSSEPSEGLTTGSGTEEDW